MTNFTPSLNTLDYKDLLESNLDTILLTYLKSVTYTNGLEQDDVKHPDDYYDWERYVEVRETIDHGILNDIQGNLGKWSFWKKAIERDYKYEAKATKNALLFVRNAFWRLGLQVKKFLDEVIKETGILNDRKKIDLDRKEEDLRTLNRIKKSLPKNNEEYYPKSAALEILESTIEKDIKWLKDKKAIEENEKIEIEKDIRKAQFFSERNGKKNVVVRDIERYGDYVLL